MILEELEGLYGPYVAEMVRQSMTLDDFRRLDIDELGQYFALRAARTYQEFVAAEGRDASASPAASQEAYLGVLRRRWQQAEELAQMIVTAERDSRERHDNIVGI